MLFSSDPASNSNRSELDPAIAAAAAFREVEAGFARWLGDDNAAFLDQAEVAQQEVDWQDDYEAKLEQAARAIPRTAEGVRALSAIFAHQAAMGAPWRILDLASHSIQRGLAEADWISSN